MLSLEHYFGDDGFIDTRALITTRTHEFSNKSVHMPGKEVQTEYSGRDEQLGNMYGLKVYANGWPSTNRGYVSVTFYPKYADVPCVGRCIISVIDASENERFYKTFMFNDKENREDKYIQYISREKLLSDPGDLLPNDVLTLQIDVVLYRGKYILRKPENNLMHVINSYEEELLHTRKQILPWFIRSSSPSSAPDTIKFRLDSPLAKCLAEESSFFRGILNTPMLEQRTKTMVIDEKEYETFLRIGDIVMKNKAFAFKSVKEIFDLCILADKYDIPAVTELCTGFLKLCRCMYSVDDYIHIAYYKYKVEGLREIILKIINLIRMTDLKEETNKVLCGVYLKQPIRKCIWLYSYLRKDLLCFTVIDEKTINWYQQVQFILENKE